ncbi:MAG: CdvA-like protein [Nitrososphaerales archaeon]|nr:CdvA-like protein [Nitrososphaerales archaeon]
MTHPSLESIIGRELKDSYGRYVGIITGISTDSNRKIQFVGVDAGSNGFRKFEGDRITFEEDSPELTSEWKLNSDSFLKTNGIAEKKVLALQELYEEEEITQDVFEHLTNRHKAQLDDYSVSCGDTVEILNRKVESLSLESSAADKFIGTLKLQHRIGDISDDVFCAAKDYMSTILQRNEKEIADLSTVLHDIAPQELTEAIETVETEDISTDEPVESASTIEMLTPETSEKTEYPQQNEPISTEMNAVSQSEAPMADEPIGMYPETESTESENETPNLELTDEDSINPDAETSTSSIYEDVTPTVEAPQEKLSETTNTYQEEPIQEPEVEQESRSFDTPEEITEVSDNITTEEPEVEQESRSFDTPEEITEVTEEIQVTETESIDNTETVSDTEDADNIEIKDSVSFDEDLTEQTEETPTNENTETHESFTEPEEERVVYSSQ